METVFEWSASQPNFRPSPPPRKLQQRQTKKESFTLIITYTSTRQQPLHAYVTTNKALSRKQVRLCNNTCLINICRSRIQMNNIVGISKPSNLFTKNIVFKCKKKARSVA